MVAATVEGKEALETGVFVAEVFVFVGVGVLCCIEGEKTHGCVTDGALATVAPPEGLVSLGRFDRLSANPLAIGGGIMGAAFLGLESIGLMVGVPLLWHSLSICVSVIVPPPTMMADGGDFFFPTNTTFFFVLFLTSFSM